jgi:Cof subfamily protein (haloacid dehalogenase superfamily)
VDIEAIEVETIEITTKIKTQTKEEDTTRSIVMKKLFITDLDHTFLRSDLSISEFSKKIWNEKAKEFYMSVATARSFLKSKELLKDLHINAPMILLDGAIVISPTQEIISIKTLPKNLADEIIQLGMKYDIDPFIIGIEDKSSLDEKFLYPRKLNKHQKDVLKGYKNDPRMQFNPDNKAMNENLKIVYFGALEDLKPLAKNISQTFGDSIEVKLSPEKYGGGWFLTLLHPDGDKAHALKEVANYLNLTPRDITVFGDSINDIGMFEYADTSVAVANALDELKDVATHILPHNNDQDGVAKYLQSQSI